MASISLMIITARTITRPLFVCALLFLISACAGPLKTSDPNIPPDKSTSKDRMYTNQKGSKESIFGEGGILGSGKNSSGGDGSGVGVNSFLWRATLDTISFMPVTSADPFGGVIITDWHASNVSPDERFKMNIYILGRQLRADGVRVSIFRQVLQNQVWRDAKIPQGAAAKIEDAVLTRARQLRNEVLGQE